MISCLLSVPQMGVKKEKKTRTYKHAHERYDTKSNVKLSGFQSQLQASYMSSHTEELWYNETVCLWIYIYIYMYILWIYFSYLHTVELIYIFL